MNDKMKNILKNILIVFVIFFFILLAIQLYQDYEYYSVYDKEELAEFFSMKDTILWDMKQAFSWSIAQLIFSIPIISFLELGNKKNIIKVIVALALTIILAIIYVITHLTIQF